MITNIIFAVAIATLVIGISICFSEIAGLRGKMIDLQFPTQSDRIYVITIGKTSRSQAEKENTAAAFDGRVVWMEYDPEKEPRPEVQVIE